MRKYLLFLVVSLFASSLSSSVFAALTGGSITLLQEDFDQIDFGSYSNGRINGVPTQSMSSTGFISGADNDWYAARFEFPHGGAIWQDVGAQTVGGQGNNTPVGEFEDDAGILININTLGLTDINVKFDWRTFRAEGPKKGKPGDQFIFGYYVGDLLSDAASVFDMAARSFDLRNAAQGGIDGIFNWSPIEDQSGNPVGFQGGQWIKVLRGDATDPFTSEDFILDSNADNQENVWLAFWLDNGEGDFGKLDNIWVGATPIPVPAAVWLLGSGLLGILGFARRK